MSEEGKIHKDTTSKIELYKSNLNQKAENAKNKVIFQELEKAFNNLNNPSIDFIYIIEGIINLWHHVILPEDLQFITKGFSLLPNLTYLNLGNFFKIVNRILQNKCGRHGNFGQSFVK